MQAWLPGMFSTLITQKGMRLDISFASATAEDVDKAACWLTRPLLLTAGLLGAKGVYSCGRSQAI
jgi:hypothetical protein